jgi:hypothetical protein
MTCTGQVGQAGWQCSIDQITTVTSPNDTINLIGQPFTAGQTFSHLNVNNTVTMDYFPTNVLKLMPNVNFIKLTNCGVKNLTVDAFNNCNQTTGITGIGLAFTHLPRGFVRTCKNLYAVAFTNGQLVTIDPNAFEGTMFVSTLDFRGNKIACIPAGMFANSKYLISINMDSNRLTSIEAGIIMGFPRMGKLSLNNNLISFIPAILTNGSGVENPIQINLSDNNIQAIDPNFIATCFKNLTTSISVSAMASMLGKTSCIPYDNQAINNLVVTTNNWTAIYATCYKNWPQYANQTYACPIPTNRVCRFYLDYLDRYTCVLDNVDATLSSISGTHSSALYTDANVTQVYIKNSVLSQFPPVLFTKFPNLDSVSVVKSTLRA